MAERPQNPGPMVRCAAGFDPDHRRRKRLEEGHHLLAPQLLTQNHLLGGVHPMKLEKMFRRVHANSANLFHGRSPLFEICNDLILAQSMPSGAVHPNTPLLKFKLGRYPPSVVSPDPFRRPAPRSPPQPPCARSECGMRIVTP